MKTILAFVASIILGSAAMAAASDYGIVAGFRSQSGDFNSTTATTSAVTGYQLGLTGTFEINGALGFRSGLMYVERPIKVDFGGGLTNDFKTTYFDIPLTLSYKFADYAGLYGGAVLAVNLSNTCGASLGQSCTITNIKSPIVPLILGAAFRFAPQIGADVFFESFGGDVATGLKNYRAVGANFVYYLD